MKGATNSPFNPHPIPPSPTQPTQKKAIPKPLPQLPQKKLPTPQAPPTASNNKINATANDTKLPVSPIKKKTAQPETTHVANQEQLAKILILANQDKADFVKKVDADIQVLEEELINLPKGKTKQSLSLPKTDFEFDQRIIRGSIEVSNEFQTSNRNTPLQTLEAVTKYKNEKETLDNSVKQSKDIIQFHKNLKAGFVDTANADRIHRTNQVVIDPRSKKKYRVNAKKDQWNAEEHLKKIDQKKKERKHYESKLKKFYQSEIDELVNGRELISKNWSKIGKEWQGQENERNRKIILKAINDTINAIENFKNDPSNFNFESIIVSRVSEIKITNMNKKIEETKSLMDFYINKAQSNVNYEKDVRPSQNSSKNIAYAEGNVIKIPTDFSCFDENGESVTPEHGQRIIGENGQEFIFKHMTSEEAQAFKEVVENKKIQDYYQSKIDKLTDDRYFLIKNWNKISKDWDSAEKEQNLRVTVNAIAETIAIIKEFKDNPHNFDPSTPQKFKDKNIEQLAEAEGKVNLIINYLKQRST